MGVFSLDIDRLYQELDEKGEKIKGIFCLQYPIYCIHANITDITPDPLDNLDNLIVKFFTVNPEFTPLQIATVFGASKSLVELRIEKLVQDDILERKDHQYFPTEFGIEVFEKETQIRQNKRSYDFYLDGISLQPLQKVFYHSYYRSKFISEDDSFMHTNSRGETNVIRPFGPDIVHTPPSYERIIDNIFHHKDANSEEFSIPNGLVSIDAISHAKLSFQILVIVTLKLNEIKKEVIDGFALYSLADNISYYDAVRRNIRIFELNLGDRLMNIEFKIFMPRTIEDSIDQPKPKIISNWPEIDRYNNSKNRCFSFSIEDLQKMIEQIFQVTNLKQENLINEEQNIAVNINRKMLLGSSNRNKLISSLIRQRDYRFGGYESNVFLLYLYFFTTDEFVKQVVDFKINIDKSRKHDKINLDWIKSRFSEYLHSYRSLLIASGEYEILEELDIEKFMKK